MLLKFSDSDEECVSFEYDEDNFFKINNRVGNTICVYYPILKLDSEYNPQNFQFYLLKNEREDYSENSIFQVCVSQKRIGWIFPIQALLSNQHDYSNNPYFLKYAYVACCFLLNNIKSRNQMECPLSEILLSDFYNESLTILVLDKDNIKMINDFSIEDYTVSLYQRGYSYSGKGNLYSEIEKADKKINLRPISVELKKVRYIHTLFATEIPKEQEEFAKFYTYYQLIEILISVVFEDRFKKFVKQLDEDIDSLFDKREELGNMVLEKQRVKWLFANYVKIPEDEKAVLNEQCKKLLQLNYKKTHENMADNLYSVRCLLVHNMYVLNDDSRKLLKEINISFLDVVMEMLLSFNTENR